MPVWLSFADERFLGVVVVDVPAEMTIDQAMVWATKACWMAGVNPGGEVLAFGPPPGLRPIEEADRLARTPRLTLLSVADLQALGWPARTLREEAEGGPDGGD